MMGAQPYTLEQLKAYAEQLLSELKSGCVLWLSGELGSGKTTFTQALVRAAGGDEAHSPSYSLVHQYDTPRGKIVHADCYRLNDPVEALDLDLTSQAEDAFLSVIEWPEQGVPYIPEPDCHLSFEHGNQPDIRNLRRIR